MPDTQKTITKVLGAQQDLTFGESTIQQKRGDQNFFVDQIRLNYTCNSNEELSALDPTQFPKATLFLDGVSTKYAHDGVSYKAQAQLVPYLALVPVATELLPVLDPTDRAIAWDSTLNTLVKFNGTDWSAV